MQKICVIAIDRAKKDLSQALEMLSSEYNIAIDSYLLVSTSFKASNAYKGDEANGFFREIVVDFNDSSLLKQTIQNITSSYETVVPHCIVEAAMSDYIKAIPYFKNSYVQNPVSLEIASEKTKMRKAFASYGARNYSEIRCD